MTHILPDHVLWMNVRLDCDFSHLMGIFYSRPSNQSGNLHANDWTRMNRFFVCNKTFRKQIVSLQADKVCVVPLYV